jgi:uncharacterized membrane protein
MNNKIVIVCVILGMILITLFTPTSKPILAEDINGDRNLRETDLLELQVDHIKQSIAPNLSGTKAKVVYTITIWNWDSTWDMYDITEVNNHGFKVEIDPTTTNKVDPDDFTSVIVEITIDNKAPMTIEDYDTTITTTSRKNDSVSESITLKTEIKQAYGVEVLPWDHRLETGDTLTGDYRKVKFQVQIENLGTGEDIFKLELHGDYSQWATLNVSSYLGLSSKEKKSMAITVKVPREIGIGDIKIEFVAISRGDDTTYDEAIDVADEVTLTVEVTQYYDLELSTSETPKTGKPGGTIEFKFIVSNLGNGEDVVELKKSDFNVNWVWTLSSSKFHLEPVNDPSGDDVKEMTLTVEIPTDIHGRNGTYNISIYVYSTNTNKGEIIQNNGKPLNFSVYVGPIYDLDLILNHPTSPDDQKTDPGGMITYDLTLINLGNSYDTIDLKAQGEKSKWVEFTNTKFFLEPFGNVKFNFTVNIPNLTDENYLDIEAEKYQISITATSENDPYTTAEVKIEPHINEILRTRMETNLPTDVTGTGYIITDPNSVLGYSSFSLTLENYGNCVNAITLSTIGDLDWFLHYLYGNYNSPTISVTISPGVAKNVIVHVYAPEDAQDGDIEHFTILARSKDDKVTSSVDIKAIVKTAVIKFRDIDISDKTAGSETTVKLTVINDGTADAEDVKINFYDNGVIIHSETISRIKVNKSVEVLFNYELEDGDHEIVARTVWSDDAVKDETTFTTTQSIDVGSTFLLLIIIAVLIIIITLIIAVMVSSRRRNIQTEPERQNPDRARFDYHRNIENQREIPDKDYHLPPDKLRPY